MDLTDFLFLVLIFVLVLAAVLGIAAIIYSANDEGPQVPTHFMCWQNGELILDVDTLHGAVIKYHDFGHYSAKVWAWQEAGIEKLLTVSNTLSCSQELLSATPR